MIRGCIRMPVMLRKGRLLGAAKGLAVDSDGSRGKGLKEVETNEGKLDSDLKDMILSQYLKRELQSSGPKNSITNPDRNMVQIEGIPKEWTEAMIWRYFDPNMQRIAKIKAITNKFGQQNGRYVIELVSKEVADTFVKQYNNDFINAEEVSSHLRVRVFELSTKSEGFKADRLERTVMIYNLPFEATNKEVSDLAKRYGEIKHLYMPMTATHKNNGYCVVEYELKASVQQIMESVGRGYVE